MGIPSTPSSGAMLEGVNWMISKTSKIKLNEKFFKDLSKIAAEFRRNPELYTSLGERIKEAKKVKSNFDKVLNKVPGGGDTAQKAVKAGSNLAAIGSFIGALALFTAQTKLTEFQQYAQDNTNTKYATDLSKTLTLLGLLSSRLKNTKKKIDNFELQDQRTRDRLYGLEKQIVPVRENANNALYEVRAGRNILEGKISDAKQQSNDALYEVRAGRDILEGKIGEARKLGNDALYETRANTATFKQQIAALQGDVSKYLSGVNGNFQNTVNATITQLKTSIADAQSQAKAAKESVSLQSKLIAEINSKIATINNLKFPSVSEIANQIAPGLLSQLDTLKLINQAQFDALRVNDSVLAGGISNLAANDKALAADINRVDKKSVVPDFSPIQRQLDEKFNALVQQNKKDLKIRDLSQSNLSKEFDKKIADFTRLSNLTNEQRFQEFQQQNNKDLGVRDLNLSNLSKEFDKKIADFTRLSNLTNEQRFDKFQKQNIADLSKSKEADKRLGADISGLKSDLTGIESDLDKLGTKIKEREAVDRKVEKKIDQMLPLLSGIPLIPGRVSDAIRPSMPTLPQINNEVGKAVCQSFTVGCGRRSLNSQTEDINNAANANKNDLLNRLNTGANAAQLALLGRIDGKLGAQIPGGIGGKLVAGFKWLQLDRALNILTFAATVHNAAMLSNDIIQTLVGALTNVLTLIIPKDDAGNTFNISEAINTTVANVVKGIVGEENYTNLTAGWAKANRIYQATTNVLNSFMSLTQTVLQAAEMIAAYTGKIGNALRKGGVVLENAYGHMNPQPKFNRVTQTLENFQQVASTVQMVTQVPLDFVNATTELTTSATEFVKAVKEDDKPANKAVEIPEPDELKAKEVAAKVASQPLPFDFSDLYDGED
jgi:hypothetical protein